MADSDNSRTLSTVTRGDFHSLVAAPLPTHQEAATHRIPGFSRCTDDPAVAAWHQWCHAWQHLIDSSAHQQRIETRLLKSADTRPERDPGYSEALEAEDRAAVAEDEAAAALWNTPARSVAGVTAKLYAILDRSQPSPTSPDDPWPQIRIVMADLLSIDAHLDPCCSTARERQPALQNG